MTDNSNDHPLTQQATEAVNTKGKGRDESLYEVSNTPFNESETGALIELRPAKSAHVAQLSAAAEAPAPPSRPSTLKPLRDGHRSLLQSVKTHLKQASNTLPGGFRGKEAERHRHGHSPHDTSPPSLLARLSDALDNDIQRGEHGPEGRCSTLSENQADHFLGSSSADNDFQPSHLTRMSAPEIMAQTRVRMAQTSTGSRSTPTSSSSPQPKDHSTPAVANPPVRISDSIKNTSSGPVNDQGNPTISPLEPTSSLGCAATATSRSSFHATPPLTTSENLFHQHSESHMGISRLGNSTDDGPSMSTNFLVDESHSSHSPSSHSKPLPRLATQNFSAHFENQRSQPPEEIDEVSSSADIDGQPSNLPTTHQALDTRAVMDAHVMEAKLRTRVKLQSRLAAEKRSHGL
ncbi:hypothetical protein H0H92_009541 [Tricholoma furcatifolium]|nr:hypothetical protein H0H92_009541 [Tricholoma furcatifolium]